MKDDQKLRAEPREKTDALSALRSRFARVIEKVRRALTGEPAVIPPRPLSGGLESLEWVSRYSASRQARICALNVLIAHRAQKAEDDRLRTIIREELARSAK